MARDPELQSALDKFDFGDWLEKEGQVEWKSKSGDKWRGAALYRGGTNKTVEYSPSKRLWHDHKTKESGTIIDFLVEIMGDQKREAIDKLFEWTGGHPRMTKEERELAKKQQDERARVQGVLTAYARFSHERMTQTERQYWLDRGLSNKTIDLFVLGFGGRLDAFLKDSDFTKPDCIKAGIATKSGECMRGRAIIPYWENGRCVYMTGRAMGDEEPKYRALATSKFDQGASDLISGDRLFNIDAIHEARRERKPLIVVEGQVDAMAITQSGWPAVSICGLSFSETKKKALVSKSEDVSVFLVLDPDKAGIDASEKIGAELFLSDRVPNVVALNSTESETDPAEFLSKHGEEAFRVLLEESPHYIEWRTDRAVGKTGAALNKEIGSLLELLTPMPAGRIPEQDGYLKEISTKTKVGIRQLRTMLAVAKSKSVPNVKSGRSDIYVRHGSNYVITAQGGVKKLVHNLHLFLEEEPVMDGLLRLDTRAHDIHVSASRIPNVPEGLITEEGKEFFARHVSRVLGVDFNSDRVVKAMFAQASKTPFDPFRDYLEKLEFDPARGPLLDTFLSKLSGKEPTQYLRFIGRMWMTSIVARTFIPGCKADYMLVLGGGQGIKKSTFFERMAIRKEWYSGSIPHLSSKDALIHLMGKVIIEDAEMNKVDKAGAEAAKSFLSQSWDIFRLPYASRETKHLRRNVFGGTTNSLTPLRDPSGDRRYWLVWLDRDMDIDWLIENRDQLYAEAVELFRDGVAWWPEQGLQPDEFFTELCEVTEKHRARHPWFDILESLLNEREIPVTVTGCLRGLRKPEERMTHSDKTRVGTILRDLGWIKDRAYVTPRFRPWIYRPPEFELHSPVDLRTVEEWSSLNERRDEGNGLFHPRAANF